ncbi:MAG: polysaccharide biosynthesis/export family protein [Roseimicrobium sp.]
MAGACVAVCVLALLPVLSSCKLLGGAKFDPYSENPESAMDPEFTSSEPPEEIRPEWLQPPTKEYTLGPGDRVSIEILGEAGTLAETIVSPDGKIYYNLLPGLEVQGKSITQAKEALEAALVSLYRRPMVSITLIEAKSMRVWVLGRLYAPGVFPLSRPLRILDAISLAGGLYSARFTGTTVELADLKHSFLKRNGKLMPVNFEKLLRDGDLSQNIYLEPNDFVYLPSSLSNEVYIFGAVVSPRSVGFLNEMNLMAALGHADGPLPEADLERVIIVRGSLVNPKYAVVNLRNIARGKATNLLLKPGDIIYVPQPGQISLERYVRKAAETFVQVVGATEGTHVTGSGGGASADEGSVKVELTPEGNSATTLSVNGSQSAPDADPAPATTESPAPAPTIP